MGGLAVTHGEVLRRANTELDLKLMKHDIWHNGLRAKLVEKYGEDGVALVEDRVIKECSMYKEEEG